MIFDEGHDTTAEDTGEDTEDSGTGEGAGEESTVGGDVSAA